MTPLPLLHKEKKNKKRGERLFRRGGSRKGKGGTPELGERSRTSKGGPSHLGRSATHKVEVSAGVEKCLTLEGRTSLGGRLPKVKKRRSVARDQGETVPSKTKGRRQGNRKPETIEEGEKTL